MRDRKGKPHVPAVGPMGGIEFPVGLEIEIALQVAHRNDVADLRTDAQDAGLEAADPVAAAAVAGKLVVDVADEADLPLLGQELGGAPVEMHVDAALDL